MNTHTKKRHVYRNNLQSELDIVCTTGWNPGIYISVAMMFYILSAWCATEGFWNYIGSIRKVTNFMFQTASDGFSEVPLSLTVAMNKNGISCLMFLKCIFIFSSLMFNISKTLSLTFAMDFVPHQHVLTLYFPAH